MIENIEFEDIAFDGFTDDVKFRKKKKFVHINDSYLELQLIEDKCKSLLHTSPKMSFFFGDLSKLSLPTIDNGIFALSEKAVDGIRLFYSLINCSVDEIYCNVLNFKYKHCQWFEKLYNKCNNITVVSSTFGNNNKLIAEQYPKVRLSELCTHCKIFLFKQNGNHFVCKGSLNFGENAKIEQITIVNSKVEYDFYKSVFDCWINIYEQKKIEIDKWNKEI